MAKAIWVRAGSIRQFAAARAGTWASARTARVSAAKTSRARRLPRVVIGRLHIRAPVWRTPQACHLFSRPWSSARDGRRILNARLENLRQGDNPLLRDAADDQIAASVVGPRGEREIPAALGANRRVRRAVGKDTEQDRSARRVDKGDHAQRMAAVGKHERDRKPQVGQSHIFGRQVAAHFGANGAQFRRLQRGVRLQGSESLVRVEVRVLGDGRAPVVPFAEEPKGPCGGPGGQKPDDKASSQLPERESGETQRRPGYGLVSRQRGGETGERRLPEQPLEGRGQRRAGLPQRVVTLAQPLVGRQTRQKG